MIITAMTPETVAAVAALEAVCFSSPWSEASIRGDLTNEWAFWLIAVEGETLLGYLGIQFGPDGGDIMSVATAPEARGTGVGKALLVRGVELLREKGLGWLTLEVRPSNAPAVGLYTKLGFREVGRRPRYNKNPPEEALLMTLFFEEAAPC